ncbi:GntR family transcriptional regulator [Georgenia sp. Z1344]
MRRFGPAPADTPLPSEALLCEEYGVSRITVRRALDELDRDGIVRREQGRGTFTTGRRRSAGPRTEVFDLTGFFHQMAAEGRRVTSRVLTQGVFAPAADVALELGVHPTAPVVRLDRLRSVDGTVDHLSRVWLSHDAYPAVATTDFHEISLYDFLRETYGLQLVEDRVSVSMVRPTGDVAALLDAPAGSLRLHTSSTAYAPDHRPIVHGRTTFASADATASFTVVTSGSPLRDPATAGLPSTTRGA